MVLRIVFPWDGFDLSGNPNEELGFSDGVKILVSDDLFPSAPGGVPDQAKPNHFVRLGNKVIFEATDGTHGRELWVSDGTTAGTHLITDINPGTANAFDPTDTDLTSADGAAFFQPVAYKGFVYFNANDGTHGQELAVARHTVDRVGGLADGATSKLLAPVRAQEMGRISFPAMLGALGLAVVVVEDAEAIARLRHRLTPREGKAVNTGDKILARRRRRLASNWKGNSEWGRIMRARQLLKQGVHKRKKMARNAIRARWAKRRKPAAGAAS